MAPGAEVGGGNEGSVQRLDRWIWFARFVRTREGAAELIRRGHVRLDGRRVTAPGRAIRPGQVLTLALDHGTRVVRVQGVAARRGPPGSEQALYEAVSTT